MTKRLLLVFILALLTTLASFGVVTGRNVYIGTGYGFTSLTGERIESLPCGSPRDTLPETRGLPKNYLFYNDCTSNGIQRNPFILDLLFWAGIYGLIFCVHYFYRKRLAKSK